MGCVVLFCCWVESGVMFEVRTDGSCVDEVEDMGMSFGAMEMCCGVCCEKSGGAVGITLVSSRDEGER